MRTIDVGIGIVTHLAFSPDGTQLAAAGHRGIGLGPWPALANGRGPFLREMTPDRMAQIAWHPSGHTFLAAGVDGVVRVRDGKLRQRRDLAELAGHRAPVLAMAFSPDGEQLAFGGDWRDEQAGARIVQNSTWRWIRSLEPHANQIGAIVFTRPNVIVTGAADRTVFVHVLSDGSQQRSDFLLTSPVQALALRPDGGRLAIAAGNRVLLWRLAIDGRPVPGDELICRGHKDVVKAVHYSPDGRTLASVGVDGTIRFWDSESGATRSALDLGLDELRAVSFAPDGLTAVAAGDAGTLVIVDVE